MIRSAGLPAPVRLRAAVHPILQNQYAALTAGALPPLVGDRRRGRGRDEDDAGRSSRPGTRTRTSTFCSAAGSPTTTTRTTSRYNLFHSGNGRLRGVLLLARDRPPPRRGARPSRGRPPARRLYRRFEHALLDAGILVPLFHDVDYRIAGPAVRGLQLRTTRPVRQLRRARKGRGVAAAPRPSAVTGGGILHVPDPGRRAQPRSRR